MHLRANLNTERRGVAAWVGSASFSKNLNSVGPVDKPASYWRFGPDPRLFTLPNLILREILLYPDLHRVTEIHPLTLKTQSRSPVFRQVHLYLSKGIKYSQNIMKILKNF